MFTMARSVEKSLLMMSLHVLLFYLLDVGRDCLVHFVSTDCGRCASLFWRILRLKSHRIFP